MPERPSAAPLRVAIVGGGITGLATAWYLRTGAGPVRPEVAIVEAGSRLGGKIRTEELAGVPVEAGPDTFLARVPWATDLARELGLGDDLVAPATGTVFVCHGGRRHPLPSATVLGVPVTLPAILGSTLVSPPGRARAALDLVLPRRRFSPDPSVAEVVGARLGREVLEHLVEPLVGGINAGRAEGLSLRSAAPQLSTAVERHRSLILGLLAERGKAGGGPRGPVFLGVSGGMQRLVERLVASLEGVDVRLGTAASALAGDGRQWRLACQPGPDVEADAVVLTVPAFAAAPVLAAVAPEASAELARIRYASVVTATLAYRPDAVGHPLEGSGFLVPRGEDKVLTACTFTTSKWPTTGRGGLVLLRPSAGRDGDERAVDLDDDALVDRLHDELAEMVGVTEVPVAHRVDRWRRALPQYEPGHEARVGRIEAALAPLGGVFVAGAAYRGLGIAACVQQAEAAAGRVMAHLSHRAVAARET